MKLLTLVFFSIVTHAASSPRNYFGTWNISRSPRDGAWVGKTITFRKNEVKYDGTFLWLNRACVRPHFRIEPYRQAPGDPTSPEDYGLETYPRESLIVKCVWPDGKLTPTFSFEILGPDRLSIYWDGALLFLDRD